MQEQDLAYAGFWVRVVASLIDTVLLVMVLAPLLLMLYGASYFSPGAEPISGTMDFLLSWVFPMVAVIVFWIYKQATPGKMIMNIRIIDANTGQAPTTGQYIGRYLGYYVSSIPLLLGLIWVGFDVRKQGWHDKLAGTLVVYAKGKQP